MAATRFLFVLALLLVPCSLLDAQTTESYPAPDQFDQGEGMFPDPVADGPIVPEFEGEAAPDWFKQPRRRKAKFEIEFPFTTAHLTNGGFGLWTEDPTLVRRLAFGLENQSGFGIRGQSWSFDQTLRSGALGRFETSAETGYVDGYRHFFIDDAELTLGGGFAYAHMKFDRDRFTGLGVDVYGDGFYPFLRFKKTEIGVTGHARFAILASIDDDIMDDSLVTIDEIGWGIELRRTFGRGGDKRFTVEITRELQHWSGISDPFEADQVFHGMALRFGFGW